MRNRLIQLHWILSNQLDAEELRTLCFYTGVNYDHLRGEEQAGKARALLEHLDKRGRISALVDAGKKIRSDIDWPEVLAVEEAAEPAIETLPVQPAPDVDIPRQPSDPQLSPPRPTPKPLVYPLKTLGLVSLVAAISIAAFAFFVHRISISSPAATGPSTITATMPLPSPAQTSEVTGATPATPPTISPTATPSPTEIPVSGRLLFSRYPVGEPSKMELCIWQAGEVNCLTVAGSGAQWSPNGQWIAFYVEVSGQTHIYRVRSDGHGLEDLTGQNVHNARDPTWSPDGQMIAFSAMQEDTDEIFVMDVEGQQISRVTANPQADRMPHWSPDPETPKLVFFSWYQEQQGIYTVDARGPNSEETRHLLWAADRGATVRHPVWSPSGESIAFLYWRGEKADICLISAPGLGEGSPDCHDVQAEPYGLAWSPDEDSVAYMTSWEGGWGIAVLDLDSHESWSLIEQEGYNLLAGLSWTR